MRPHRPEADNELHAREYLRIALAVGGPLLGLLAMLHL